MPALKSSTRNGIIVFTVFALLAVAAVVGLNAVTTTAAGETEASSGFPVCISEVMASNDSYPDARGNAYDWVELYNSSDLPVTLTNYKLTDSEQRVRYIFPTGAEIPAHGYFVVWCRSNAGGGYADFSISKMGGETIVLMNSHGVIVDRLVTLPMDTDMAMARGASGDWETFPYGTPGFDNSRSGYDAYLAAHREDGFSVRINEIMSANRSYANASGHCCDWVELYNDSDGAVDLSGHMLSDRRGASGYVFAEGTQLAGRAYLVVYCDGSVADPAYAPFSLTSRGGERVLLMTRSNVVLDEAVTQPLEADTVLARGADGAWAVSAQPTPGYENSEAGYAQFLAASQAEWEGRNVRITEVMPSNRSCLQDAFGNFSDWIELTNYGTEAVGLRGCFLSDDAARPAKWAIPDVTLPAGGRIVVFASGRDTVADGELHAGFALNKQHGVVMLYASAGRVLSQVSYEAPGDDTSVCADEETGALFTTRRATPGYPNTDAGYEGFSQASVRASGLLINEVMTGNDAYLRQARAYYDWVELKNVSDREIDLAGYNLSDRADGGARQSLPAMRLPPGGLCVVLCTGQEPLARSAYAQVALSLDAQQEQLYLFDGDGAVVDYLWLHDLPYQGSGGRMPGENGQFYFSKPTPGRENEHGYRTITRTPEASVASGVFRNVDAVEVSLTGEGTVYYTLDGSIPTSKSKQYTAPLRLTETTVLRAAAVAEGKMISRVATWSYILNAPHTLPIVSVVTDPRNLTDGTIGIFARANLFDRTVERPAHIDCFIEDGGFSTDCGLKLHGAGTRGRASKKSFKITFRGRYGVSPLNYPLFEDNDTRAFYSILLRNGQDAKRAYLRDEMLPYLAYRASDELFVQDCRYSVLYLNGTYRGLYVIKEAFSSGYFSVHYGVDRNSVEVQRGYIENDTEFAALLRYARRNDLREEVHYRYIADRVNLESLIDWCVIEGYAANHDLSVNVRYLRSTEYDDNRWHYALFDLDYGFDGPATFDYLLHDKWHGVIPRALMKNEAFQDLFLRRMAYLLEHVLTPEAIERRCEAVVASIRDEIPRDRAIWPGKGPWDVFYANLKRYLSMDRAAQLKRSAADAMGIPLAKVESYFGRGTA